MMHFTEDMKIGVPHIDAQHSSLIDFVNKAAELCASSPDKEEMKECLDFLGNYVVQHFSDEEQIQIESKYPRYKQHREIHNEFVETFKSLYAKFQEDGPTEEIAQVLANQVTSWVFTHIEMEDAEVGKYYNKVKSEHLKTHTRNNKY